MAFQYIAIEGPIGVGKTSLAQRLAARLDATTVLEETDNPFLADFYAGRAGSALQTQLFYLLNRHRQQLTMRQGDLFSQAVRLDQSVPTPIEDAVANMRIIERVLESGQRSAWA